MTAEHRALTVPLRIGVATSMLGIAIACVSTVIHLEHFAGLLEFSGYASWMLPAIVLGIISIVIAAIEIVRTARYGAAASVFGLGLAAIVTPFFILILAIAVGLVVAAAVLATLFREFFG